ncbi:MAG: hypothetical protein IPK59_22040 [Rhodospirillaceae bacterium]|nr:hypothetical protein [Rhodospirillaceae bacterium]
MSLDELAYSARLLVDRITGGIARTGRAIAREIDWEDYRPGRPTVLCLRRALFAKDIAELKKRTDLNLPCIHVTAIKRPQERWVAPKWRRQAHLWHDLNALPALRNRLEEFGVAFLDAARAQHPIDAVAAANTDYWQDEALRMGCRRLGIPFIALSRESYGIGRGRDFVANNYKSGNFYFNGTGCAVASDVCADFMRGQAAMRDAVICTTGWPRYDAWRDYPMPPLKDRKWITLMAYGDPRQVQYAAANFRDVLNSFAKAAERQLELPEAQRLHFVIKMKKRNEDDYIRAIRPDLDALGIEILADMPLPDIVTRSRMIVGFNTLAVLEGLLGGCAVVVPVWSDSERDRSASLLHPDNPDDDRVCYFPRNPADFEALLGQAEAGTLPPKGSLQERLARFSRHSVVTSDVTASQRFETFVRSLLAQADERRRKVA